MGLHQIYQVTSFAAAVMVVSSPASGGGWSAQTSGTTQLLTAVHFPVDAITGYVVGNNGTILKTTNGGANWTAQTSGTTNNFFSVHFPVDAHTGYAVASSGTIVKSTDCGTNWNTQTSNTTEHLYHLHFPVDTTTGYVVGFNATILKTSDGGTNWDPQTSPTAVRLESVHFPADATTGYIAGYSGTILKTTDGGITWNAQTSGTTENLRDVDFPVDATTGYAVGDNGTILKTTNGGTNWSVQSSGVTTHLYAVHFPVDATTGFAVGSFNATETVLKTTDGGVTWVLLDAFAVDVTLYGIHFPVDATTGYAVGQDGTIVKTTDGGGIQTLLHPTGNGSVNGFTSQTGCPAGNWDCVNDQAGNAGTGAAVSNDGTTSYLQDGSNQTNREMFSLDDGAIPAGSTVTKIEVRAWVGRGSGSGKKIRLSYQRIGTDASPVNGLEQNISGATGCCLQLKTSSWSGLGWSTSDLDSLEIGILHADGGQVNVSQIYVRVSHHEPDYVLSDHGGGGQQPDAFTGAAGENDAELFGMNLDPGSDTISVTQLVFRLSNISGLTDPDWTFGALVVDDNNDGDIDFSETTTVGGVETVDQAAGTITFPLSFNVSSATNYILRMDFSSLSDADTVTIALDPADITTTASATGSTTAVTHHEGFTGSWMATGSYTGNSPSSQSITGVGFQPQVVFVKKYPANKYGYVRTATMSGDASKKIHYSNPLEADLIKSLDPDGFTIGTAVELNASGDTGYWIAFGNAPGTLKVGTYPGTGVTKSICGVGFQPNVVMVFGDGGTDVSCFRTSTMPDNTSAKFDTAPNGQLSNGSNWIKLLEPDGFQVGTNAKVNKSGITYHYVAFKTTAGQVEVGTYGGDATNNHDIPVSFEPKYVIVYGDDPGLITAGGSHAIIHRPDSMVGNTSLNMSWGYAADTFVDTIQALEPTGFQVGSDVTVNQSATTYHWMAFASGSPSTSKPRIISWAEVDPYP